MTEERLRLLQPIPRGSGNPLDPHHLVYSRRWMAAGATMFATALVALAASVPPRQHPAGRAFVSGLALLGSGMLLGAGIGSWRLQVEPHTLALAGWPRAFAGLRIGHLSDIHLGPGYSRYVLRRALAALQRFQPDIILLTGDFARKLADLPTLRTMLCGINAPLGVFACLGNHDYWEDPVAVALTLHELGITVLVNEHRVIEHHGEWLVVAGVADPWQSNADLEQALAGAPVAPVVLLAHGPDFITTAAKRGVALQLSGHAHAGHINLPWLGPLVLPRWGVAYPNGRYQVGASTLYVSRGIGGLPLRLGATPEVGLLTTTRDERVP